MSSSLEIHNQAYPIAVRDQGIIAKTGGDVVKSAAGALTISLPLYTPIFFSTQTGAGQLDVTLPRIPRDGRTQVQYLYHRGVNAEVMRFTPQAAVVGAVPYLGDTVNNGIIGAAYDYTISNASPKSVNVLVTLISFHCPAFGANANSAGWIINVASFL